MKKKTHPRQIIIPTTGMKITLRFYAITLAATARTLTEILMLPHMQQIIKK